MRYWTKCLKSEVSASTSEYEESSNIARRSDCQGGTCCSPADTCGAGSSTCCSRRRGRGCRRGSRLTWRGHHWTEQNVIAWRHHDSCHLQPGSVPAALLRLAVDSAGLPQPVLGVRGLDRGVKLWSWDTMSPLYTCAPFGDSLIFSMVLENSRHLSLAYLQGTNNCNRLA